MRFEEQVLEMVRRGSSGFQSSLVLRMDPLGWMCRLMYQNRPLLPFEECVA